MTDTLITAVVALVARCAELPPTVPLGEDTRLVGGGLALDSIRVLELSVAVEEEFGVLLSEEDLVELRSIGSLVALVRRKRDVAS